MACKHSFLFYTLFHVMWTTVNFNRSHSGMVSPFVASLLPTPPQRVTHEHWILGGPRNKTRRKDTVCWNFDRNVMQIAPQVPRSPGALYCEPIVKMKRPMDLWSESSTNSWNIQQVEGTATGRFFRSCVSLLSEQFRLHFCCFEMTYVTRSVWY